MSRPRPPLSYHYAVMQEQATELFAKLAPLCDGYTLQEVIAASCEIVCRVLASASADEPRDARTLRDAFCETLEELDL
jgi:hypothetical protein